MKISHFKDKVVQEEVIDDVLCNKCGNSLGCGGNGHEGLIEVKIAGGYGSKLGDGNYYTFSICVDCCLEMFKTFKHPVKETIAGWAAMYYDDLSEDDVEKEPDVMYGVNNVI